MPAELGAPGDQLSCPRCARLYGPEERFCAECGMPLVPDGGGEQGPSTDAHGRARKVRPQYSKGRLIRVAVGRNEAESELIQGVLLEQGIPSMLRRTGGFDVPDMIAAGPRDVLVPESGATAARELLGEPDPAVAAARVEDSPARSLPLRLAAALFVVLLASGALVGVALLFVR